MVIALLFFSFKPSYLTLDNKSNTTITKSITKIFNSETYDIDVVDDTFCAISKLDSIVGYLAVTDAPSKFHMFDYYILFDNQAKILKIEILHYRENYGAEICSKKWLKQFTAIDTEKSLNFHNSIDGISGATISVNSLKNNVFKVRKKLKRKLL